MRPATYIAIRVNMDGTETVLGSFVSSPGDVHRDAPRLYGAGIRWVSWSAANRLTRNRVRAADKV